ncbi:MAG TPA: hypothetical protein VNU66_12410 [Mycobacteriales bacterium]|nr:hypothetical protein [Mycobacteriales bacterium]
MSRLRRDADAGNAMLEFVYLSVLLMVPLVYVLTTTFQVQRAAFGVTEAARQAGRAYATAESDPQGRARAEAAARLALRDQGVELAEPLQLVPSDGVAPGSVVRVRVTHRVALPLVGGLFRGVVPPNIPVRADHVAVVDRFKS